MYNIQLRFKKFDRYDNPVFIAGKDEPVAYELLSDLRDKLEGVEDFKDLFLPIYVSDEFHYATLRCWREAKLRNLTEGATYDVVFELRKKIIKERPVVAVNVLKVKLLKKPAVQDKGEVITF